jgi:outer membrane protein assembly factor BamB
MGKRNWLTIGLLLLFLSSLTPIADATSVNDDWPMFRGNPERSGYTTSNTTANSAQFIWKYPTSASVISSPAIADGILVFGCKDCYIYCVNASTGKAIWSFKVSHEVNSSPAIYEGKVYVGSYDGWLYCMNLSSGVPVWGKFLGGQVLSSPLVVADRAYIGSPLHDVFCFNASTGDTLWTYQTKYRVNSSPAIANGTIYVSCDDYYLYALNASTGEEIWRSFNGSNFGTPAISGGFIYTGAYMGWVTCTNATSGARTWIYQTDDTIASSAAVAYGRVYVGSEDGSVYCFNASDGLKLWQTKTGYWVWSSPAVANGYVFVGSEDYHLYCLDAYTGAMKWSIETDCMIDSSPAIVGDMLYFGSSDYHLYAFQLSDASTEVAEASTPIFWSTIVFDLLFCLAWGTVIFVVARHLYFSWKNKQDTQSPAENAPKTWFVPHVNLLAAALILLFTAVYLLNINHSPMWAADEKTYSQIAYHFVKSGDYWTPWVTGDPAWWVGKPPLLMWLTSVSYQVFGVTNFAARIWVVLFGVLSLVMVYLLGKKLYNAQVGLVSIAVLGSFVTFYQYSTHMMTDVPLIFFMLASIYYLLLCTENKDAPLKYALLSGAFFGLALMTKQLEALLIPAIMLVYMLFTKRIRFVVTKRFGLFVGVAGAIFIPYLAYNTWLSKDFWDCFFIYSNVSRITTPLEGHTGDFFFYFQQLFVNEIFWAVFLPFALALAIYNVVFKQSRADVLVVGWIIVVLGLFTIAQTKLFWYILPAMPAFALSIANLLYQLAHYIRSRTKRRVDTII